MTRHSLQYINYHFRNNLHTYFTIIPCVHVTVLYLCHIKQSFTNLFSFTFKQRVAIHMCTRTCGHQTMVIWLICSLVELLAKYLNKETTDNQLKGKRYLQINIMQQTLSPYKCKALKAIIQFVSNYWNTYHYFEWIVQISNIPFSTTSFVVNYVFYCMCH